MHQRSDLFYAPKIRYASEGFSVPPQVLKHVHVYLMYIYVYVLYMKFFSEVLKILKEGVYMFYKMYVRVCVCVCVCVCRYIYMYIYIYIYIYILKEGFTAEVKLLLLLPAVVVALLSFA